GMRYCVNSSVISPCCLIIDGSPAKDSVARAKNTLTCTQAHTHTHPPLTHTRTHTHTHTHTLHSKFYMQGSNTHTPYTLLCRHKHALPKAHTCMIYSISHIYS